jgi:hypothetical protein
MSGLLSIRRNYSRTGTGFTQMSLREDRATGVAMRRRILDVRVTGPFQLALSFTDGSSGVVDLRSWIAGRGGVFAPLQDESFFAQVDVDTYAGTIVWPNGVDLDPDMLYDAAHGATDRTLA